MKNVLLMLLLTAMLAGASSLKGAEDEIVWELEGVGVGIGDIIVTNTQNTFLNTYNSSIQIRNIEDGLVIDSINLKSYFSSIDKISITNDDRYLAVSGDGPNLLIWDLENKREYKKISKIVYDGDSAHTWKSVSISPDGTKVSAIGIIEPAGATELVVFDLETEEVILSEFRQWTDQIDLEDYTPIWVSSEFSPSGDYLVTELSTIQTNSFDSVYIYNSNNFVIEGKLLNNHREKDISFSKLENIMSSNFGQSTKIYNLKTKELLNVPFERQPQTVLFSKLNPSKILISLGTRAYIYDYSNNNEIYEYLNNISAKVIAKDDSKVIGFSENGLFCIKTFWTKTSVENNTQQSTYFPNPVTNLLNIKFNVSFAGQYKYDLFDINSIKIATNNLNFLQSGINEISINFSPFPSQTYYLKIYSPNESYNFKIVKE